MLLGFPDYHLIGFASLLCISQIRSRLPAPVHVGLQRKARCTPTSGRYRPRTYRPIIFSYPRRLRAPPPILQPQYAATIQSALVGLGFGNTGKGGPGGSGGPNVSGRMGNFTTQGSNLNDDDRFMSSTGRVTSGPSGLSFGGRPPPVVRSASEDEPGVVPGQSMRSSHRTRSKRKQKK
jgi:hypothetical protein